MASKKKGTKVHGMPDGKKKRIKGSTSCRYCQGGYVQIGNDVHEVSMECGYCLGSGARLIP